MAAHKPVATSTKPRVGPYTRLTQIWRLVFYSLGLDALIALFNKNPFPIPNVESAAILCALLSLPFLNQRAIAVRMSSLRSFHKRGDQKKPKALKATLIMAATLVAAAKFLALSNFRNIVGLIFSAILLLGIVTSLRHAIESARVHGQALKDSPWLQLSLWEKQLIIIFTIPIVAARLVSLLGALSVSNSEVSPLSIGCFGASVVLLLVLKPQRANYIGMCAKCKTPIPIVFVEYGSCPACNQELAEKLRS